MLSYKILNKKDLSKGLNRSNYSNHIILKQRKLFMQSFQNNKVKRKNKLLLNKVQDNHKELIKDTTNKLLKKEKFNYHKFLK